MYFILFKDCLEIFHLIALPNVCYVLFPALTIQRNCDSPLPATQNRSVADIEEHAANYERKLIEVSTGATKALVLSFSNLNIM